MLPAHSSTFSDRCRVGRLGRSVASSCTHARACADARARLTLTRTRAHHLHHRHFHYHCHFPTLSSSPLPFIHHHHHHPVRQHRRLDMNDTVRNRTGWSWTQSTGGLHGRSRGFSVFPIIWDDDEMSHQALSSVSHTAGPSMLFASQTANHLHHRH